ncbi:MAG: glycosyltransferase family A protein [Gudongella sp.]|nr:glycosyltransferase family A protein [Gudongella sp.]
MITCYNIRRYISKIYDFNTVAAVKTPEVSVIVPVRNGSEYVHRIVDILAGQTYSDFEVIFVACTESADDSVGAVELNMGRLSDSRIVLQEDAGGLGGAKNLGMDNARGHSLWFLDVDDVPSPTFLSEMMSMKAQGADIVICNFIYTRRPEPVRTGDGDYSAIEMDRLAAMRLRLKGRIPVTSWSMLYDAGMVLNHGIRFPRGIAEDIWFTCVAISCSSKICYLTKPLYAYIQNPGSICNDRDMNDERGASEIRRYDDLEVFFLDDAEMSRVFDRGSALVRLRSSGHMSYVGFMGYAKGRECREMIRRNLSSPLSPEALAYLCFPRLYYAAIRTFFLYYYREGRIYTRPEMRRMNGWTR